MLPVTASAERTSVPALAIPAPDTTGNPGTVPPPGEEGLVNGIIGKPFDFSQIGETITSILANESMLENAGAL